MFISLVAIAFAARHASDEAPVFRSRAPAAIEVSKKELILGPLKAISEVAHTEKLRGPLSVRLELIGPKPVQVGDVFVMRGTLATRKDLNSANFTWTIPQGLELVNGELTGTVQALTADQPARIELTLRKLTPGNRQVHLMANSSLNEMRFGDSSLYNTDVQDLMNKNAVVSGAHETPGRPAELKIFH
jgi:hypothetical protein